MEKKSIIDCKIVGKREFGRDFALLSLTPADGSPLPKIRSGQFVQVEVPNSKTTFLRRPISVCLVIESRNVFSMLVRRAGAGTAHLIEMKIGQMLNVILPLGNGWTVGPQYQRPLLIGGGVGQAPLGQLANEYYELGIKPTFLLAAKSEAEHHLMPAYKFFGDVEACTDDGSMGHHGLVTEHPICQRLADFDIIYCCGPTPMMRAVARLALEAGVECEVSLENEMACGLGACLCCVQDTNPDGNVCVCTDGPVFNVKRLKW